MKSPLELLFGAQFKGPAMVDVRSHATKQFAGRTTLNSGSATVTVSTAAVKSDSLIWVGLEGNANLPIKVGTVNINSNAATATVSDSAITTTHKVFLSPKQNGTAQGSGTANRSVEVVSLATGWFSVGWSDGGALSNRLTPVDYVAYPTDGPPAAIEVKTLSDGSYFTLGRADGRAVGRDAKILWQISHSSHH